MANLNTIEIKNSTEDDMSTIFELYKLATAYMKSKNQVAWPEFSQAMVSNEIRSLSQWKLLIDGKIACIWATALEDESIWGPSNNEPSLYLHRIATHPDFRGQKLVQHLLNWADGFGRENQLMYLRMDTVGLNQGLIGHYQGLGFEFLGTKTLEDVSDLPGHYKEGPVCLFQREVKKR